MTVLTNDSASILSFLESEKVKVRFIHDKCKQEMHINKGIPTDRF